MQWSKLALEENPKKWVIAIEKSFHVSFSFGDQKTIDSCNNESFSN